MMFVRITVCFKQAIYLMVKKLDTKDGLNRASVIGHFKAECCIIYL